MLTLLKILSGFSVIGSITWCVARPGYEPAIAIITSLITFIGCLIGDNKNIRRERQNQTVAQGGVGIQVGGNANIGSIRTDEKVIKNEK